MRKEEPERNEEGGRDWEWKMRMRRGDQRGR